MHLLLENTLTRNIHASTCGLSLSPCTLFLLFYISNFNLNLYIKKTHELAFSLSLPPSLDLKIMASSVEENTSFSRFQDSAAFENRPRMLKDFLRDDCLIHSCTSSSSNGFPMYPRKKPCKSTILVSNSKSNKPSIVLLRSRSKKAAATTISAIHKVINVVKFFQFASVKSPLVTISRNLPKRRSKDRNDTLGDVSEVKVKVKDILRWRSFRDLVEDSSTPLDFSSSPNRSTTTTATTSTTTSCSKRSSWCDSDFTSEELPLWNGENEEFLGKKCTNAKLRNPKEECPYEEYEQQSPVSVLDSPFREVEESISPFHPSRANIEKTKCMLTRRIQEVLEGVNEPKCARKRSFGGEIAILEGAVNASEEEDKQLSQANHILISDLFMHELSMNENTFHHDVDEFDSCEDLRRIAESWMNGEYDDECYGWEVEDKRETYVKDMEKGVDWKRFKQEQEVMSKELEVKVLNELIDELLGDLLIN